MSILLRYIIYGFKVTELVGYDIHSADDIMAAGFNWCPPLAMIQAFGEADNFELFCREHLDTSILNQIDLENLLQRDEPSKYDYRRFIRAKH